MTEIDKSIAGNGGIDAVAASDRRPTASNAIGRTPVEDPPVLWVESDKPFDQDHGLGGTPGSPRITAPRKK